MDKEQFRIEDDEDLNRLRSRLRAFAGNCDFSDYETTKLITAASEVSRNILNFAESGEVQLEMSSGDLPEVRAVFEDEGPGIENIDKAMEDGYSGEGSSGLGVGLPGAERLSDEFEIESSRGTGTTVSVTVRKDQRR